MKIDLGRIAGELTLFLQQQYSFFVLPPLRCPQAQKDRHGILAEYERDEFVGKLHIAWNTPTWKNRYAIYTKSNKTAVPLEIVSKPVWVEVSR